MVPFRRRCLQQKVLWNIFQFIAFEWHVIKMANAMTPIEETVRKLKDDLETKCREIDTIKQKAAMNPNEENNSEKCISRSTQTSSTGESCKEERKKIRSLKRQLKGERATRDLMSFVNPYINLSKTHQQRESLVTSDSRFSRQWEQKAEEQHYERTRKLLDSHANELERLKMAHEEEMMEYANDLRQSRRKMKQVRKKNVALQYVVTSYKSVVKESQQKALDVCQDVFEELEAEQEQVQRLQARAISLQGENEQLRQALVKTTRQFDQTKLTLMHMTVQSDSEKARFNSVMSVLSNTAAASVDIHDSTKDLRFSQIMTRPAGL